MTRNDEKGLPICQRCQAKETPMVLLWFLCLPSFYITIDHRLGFVPRFYQSSNPLRYFCQLYHWLSPGFLVTRKQPGDIIRAYLRKSTHSGSEFPYTRVKAVEAKFDIGAGSAALPTISISREIRSVFAITRGCNSHCVTR